MIRVHNSTYADMESVVEIKHFPDCSQLLLFNDEFADSRSQYQIDWKYESDEELVTLMYIVNHLRYAIGVREYSYSLSMDYIPNARMDRVKNRKKEVFTLKYFCNIINDLKFRQVTVLDAHSNVSLALLDRVQEISPEIIIKRSIYKVLEEDGLKGKDLILFFPDAGSMKRYSSMMDDLGDILYCHGEKERDWETGELKHEINIINDFNVNLNGKTILMIDDIIAYGGTMINSARALKAKGVGNIYIYATHVENSILSKERLTLVDIETVKKIYTTNSLYSGTHDKIEVIG